MKDDMIRHLEILEDDVVVYSYDKTGEYKLKKNETLLHLYYSSKRQIKPFQIELSVTDGAIRYFEDRLRIRSARESKWVTEPKVSMNWKSNFHRRGGLFIVNNKDQAILNIKSTLFDEHFKISDIANNGQMIKHYDGTVTMCVEVANKAVDVAHTGRLLKKLISM